MAYMSVLSFLEVLVKPKKENNLSLENRYNYPSNSFRYKCGLYCYKRYEI